MLLNMEKESSTTVIIGFVLNIYHVLSGTREEDIRSFPWELGVPDELLPRVLSLYMTFSFVR